MKKNSNECHLQGRKQYGTSLNPDLYMDLKQLAARLSSDNLKNNINKRIFTNDLMEEGLKAMLDKYDSELPCFKRKTERIDVSLRLNEQLYLDIKILALKKNVNANDLIEEGMEYILEKYK
ncbi:TPA: hypothetical protein ACSQRE_000147 [Clostridium perfringens]